MSWINTKSVAAIAAAALLGGTAGYLAQKQKADQLQAKSEAALAQLEQAKADLKAAQKALAARDQELQKMQTVTVDLARARNQIAQLRQPRQTAAQNASSPANAAAISAARAAFPPGAYVSREQLAFAGYSSPEATMQSLAWAAINGQTNIVENAVSSDMPQSRQFAAQLQMALQSAGPFFKGMQIQSQKALADDSVELKIKVDVQSDPSGSANLPPPFNLVRLMRVDNEWKINAEPQDYTPDWEKTGQIKTFAQ